MSKKFTIRPLGFPWETRDPFIFCVHHRDEFPKGNENMGPAVSLSGRNIGQDFVVKDGWRMYHGQQIPGFPYHPHRGFETVTVVKEGVVDHTDSMGASGRFSFGDVQWMTAGKGVLHSEMFPLLKEEEENPMELFQIWLNLPKVNKFVEPHFKMLWNEQIPKFLHEDSNDKQTIVDVIAGEVSDVKSPDSTPSSWAADRNHHVAIWTIKMEAGAEWLLPASVEGVNRILYYYKGAGFTIENNEIPDYHSIQVSPIDELMLKAGSEDCFLLLLQGQPINEPVVQHGPFVMNTEKEIQDAFREYRQTQFGGWPWPNQEQVHPREVGRFAKHADGREENK
jgi:redox-sensitive bicupin YhaK (pirin superfamily)